MWFQLVIQQKAWVEWSKNQSFVFPCNMANWGFHHTPSGFWPAQPCSSSDWCWAWDVAKQVEVVATWDNVWIENTYIWCFLSRYSSWKHINLSIYRDFILHVLQGNYNSQFHYIRSMLQMGMDQIHVCVPGSLKFKNISLEVPTESAMDHLGFN